MFTGLVQDIGIIKEIKKTLGGLALRVETQFSELCLGESISVDGVCLTVTQIDRSDFWCELSPETLAKTIASSYVEGSEVNLERALKLGDRLGGHWVTGHVDGLLELSEKEHQNEFLKLTFCGVQPSFRDYLVEKGSIAINGISLTLNQVGEADFNVMIIPHTFVKTNLKHISERSRVNVEFDGMAKLMVQTAQRYLKSLKES